ncbi:MAG: hypothetical protein CVU39_20265 [Chloroflexi bacterium HGW-Chloroflexi-10]|nr:MAG: hypothetical protein CVU39_20265 [Chloroflexi bacterium HGW-Chloroflexi-10]
MVSIQCCLNSRSLQMKFIAFFLIITTAFSLLGMNIQPVAAQSDSIGMRDTITHAWAAYNDCVYVSSDQYIGNNVTTFGIGDDFTGDSSGELLNRTTGVTTGVTATLTTGGSGVNWQTDTSYDGDEPASGTDAYATFHDIADMNGLLQYGSSSSDWNVDLEFSGLDPSKTYSFATSASRNGSSSYTNRVTRFSISGALSATNASTEGVTVVDNENVAFDTGTNNTQGYVARWTGIQPAADGTFTVTAQPHTTTRSAYAFSVFMLAEESGIPQTTLTFQQGISSYTGTHDTYLESASPSTNRATTTPLVVDGSPEQHVLLFFDEIFGIDTGTDAGKIPTGASIQSASLQIYVTNASPDGASLHRMLQAWSDTDTWNTWGNGIDADGIEAEATADSSGFLNSTNALYSIDVTTDLQIWANDPDSNFGWAWLPNGDDSWQFTSSEGTTSANRPKLTVSYTIPITDPTITTTGTLMSFSSTPGVASTEQSYTVTGINLTDNIAITAPSGFQLSTNGTNYSSSLTLNQSSGSVSTTTIYVRLHSDLEGAFSGNITHTSYGATTVDVAVSGTVSNTVCSTANLTATEDTYLSANDVAFNNGGRTELHVDATTGTSRRTTLMKWDLSSIPANATVSAATLSLYVSDASPLTFNLYNMRRSWVEGTSNRTDSTNSANWNTYDGSNSWGAVGVADISTDRYDTNLWNASTISFSSTGGKTVALNNAGVAVVQGWINESASNYGLTMLNHSGTTSNALFFSSSEATTAANRPTLNVTYCVISGPTIITTGTLTTFNSTPGVVSAEQSYTVGGSNLTNDITIITPANFEISNTSGSGFGPTITLPQNSGTVATTPIYVRFLRSTVGTSSGNITHTSSGATQVNIPISGMASNGAPAVSLVQPTDNATGVATPVTLSVTVTDPEADPMDVSFYGRPVGSGSGEDFMIVLTPDAQNASQNAPNMFTSQTNWIVNNKSTNNIVFVTSLGDMVNNSTSATEYTNADAAVDILDAGNVWYTMATGNHDIAYGPTLYTDYFGVSRYAGYQYSDGYWFGGAYDDYNTYSLFSAGGMDFILINLQYSPNTAVLDWADALLTTYSSRRAIVEQHDILNINDSWYNQASYTALRDHDNLFLMVCGHMHSASDGAAYVAGTGTGGAGQTIHVVLADYQDMNNGNGYLRLLRFSPTNDMIYMTTYSPYTSGYITTDPDQKNLVYDMESSEAFTLIDTVSGVTSGSNANLSWSGLSDNTEYEWYAVANDGATSTTSDTWNFTTGEAAPACNALTLSHTGSGSDPIASPANSSGCPSGQYVAGESISLSGAAPSSGWQISSWTGTTNNASTAATNTVSMPAGAHSISVNYTAILNHAPVFTAIGNKTVNELATLAFTATAIDEDLDTLTFSLMSAPTGATMTAAGAFTWTPTEAQGPGSYSFTVKVCDAAPLCDEEEITISVNDVNTAPILTAIGNKTVNEQATLTFTATATDGDLPANILTFNLMSAPTGAVITMAGAFTWTPTEAQGPGSYQFTVRICDNGTPILCDEELITVTVNEVNLNPLASDDTYETVEDTQLVVAAPGVLVNDTDPENDALTVSRLNGPSHGTLTLNSNGSFTYSPAQNFTGIDSFTYTVSDGKGGSDTATVTITVLPGIPVTGDIFIFLPLIIR